MKLAAVILGTLLLTACGGDEQVDWSGVPDNQRRLIEQAVDDGNCEAMQGFFDQTEDADVLAYLDGQMEDAGCYG